MGDLFQPVHILVLLIIAGICLIPGILFLLTLQGALSKCHPSVRKMEPGMVWLLLLPFFNLVWYFFVVTGIGKSLGGEFRRRGIATPDPYPTQSVGMALAICNCCCIIPQVNILAGIGVLVLWIVYWVKVAEYSRLLGQPQAVLSPGQPS